MTKPNKRAKSVAYRETSKCLICLKKACVWGGHVRRGKEIIIAGWCRKHIDHIYGVNLMKKQGCYGGYHGAYGLIPTAPKRRARLNRNMGISDRIAQLQKEKELL